MTKDQQSLGFYSVPEFDKWKEAAGGCHTWKVKYYKGQFCLQLVVNEIIKVLSIGLGALSAKEAKEYFSKLGRHRIQLKYRGKEDDQSIILAFSKKKIGERKEWLRSWMEERKRRKEQGLPEDYLCKRKAVTYQDFVNKELVSFCNMDNERSIPCLMDGFKPGQRKVFFTCLNLVDDMKVLQLAGSVTEKTGYLHSETSLIGTIVGLAQNYVGSNNINLLLPIGQFGTRLSGGKDTSSSRFSI